MTASAQQLANLAQQHIADTTDLETQAAEQADGGSHAALAALIASALAGWVAAFGALTAAGTGTALARYLAGVRRDVAKATADLETRAVAAFEDRLADAATLGAEHAMEFALRAADRRRTLHATVPDDALHAVRSIAATVREQLRISARLLADRQVQRTGWRGVLTGIAAARRAAVLAGQIGSWAIHRAVNAGAAQAVEALGARALWVTEPDACVRCLAYAGRLADADGTWLGGLSLDPHQRAAHAAHIDGPPLHPHCFPAGTTASGPGVRAATDRWYEGEMVEVRTRCGRVLTATPNHPVLTTQGWVAAGLLHEGSQVVGDTALNRVLARDPDDYQKPALIEDIARSLRSALGVTSVRVPVAPENFHGDGTDGEVDVVWANRLLWGGGQVPQPFGEKQFGRASADLLALAGGGDLCAVCGGLGTSAHGSMGRFDVGAALLRSPSGVRQSVSFGLPPELHALLNEEPLDNGASRTNAIRDALDALATLIAFNEVGDAVDAAGAEFNAIAAQEIAYCLTADALPGCDGAQTLTGAVALDEVVGVRRFPWSGHVYNLETSGGWYTANGIIVHNCRCRAAPWKPEWAPRTGLALPDLLQQQAWQSAAAGRGRPSESRAARLRAARTLLNQPGVPARLRQQARSAVAAGHF